MSDFIDHIYISNFKSIKECDINGCKRINLLIGRPNVGKSNILEALSLFSVPYLKQNFPNRLSTLIRVENEPELFYEGGIDSFAMVNTNISKCKLFYSPQTGLELFMEYMGQVGSFHIDSKNLRVRAKNAARLPDSPIKKYYFTPKVLARKAHAKYLIPPIGNNLLSVISAYPMLSAEVAKLFESYAQKIAFDKASLTIKIIKSTSEGIFLIPYNSIADTLQRIIFYKAAIASNTNSILLFEEPEAHSFPPYMTHLTQEMIHRKDNQFFVATHSPHILNDLLENGRDELSVFVVDYKEGQTVVKRLSDQDLHDITQYGLDIFTNNELFL